MSPSITVEILPDELIIRILSLLRYCADVLCCAQVSKRWFRLAKLVTHFTFYWEKLGQEEGFIRWLGYDHNQLRQLFLIKLLKHPASLAWLPAAEKKLHSLSISSDGELRDIWCSIAALRELRCLHIRGDIAPELPTSPLPRLIFCMIRCHGFTLFHAEQLLELCPSLLSLRVEILEVHAPGFYHLRSQSLDFIHFIHLRGKTPDSFTLVVEMPKLRWLLLPFPSVHLHQTTTNLDWVWIDERVLEIQGLGYSKPTKLLFAIGRSMAASLIPKILAMFGSRSSILRGVKELDLAIYHDKTPEDRITYTDVGALLELFPNVEKVMIHFRGLRALEWSGRQLPLTLRVEFHPPQNFWESQGYELEFLRGLMKTSSGMRLECQGYAVCGDMMPPFQDFSDDFRGRNTLSKPGGIDEAIRALVEFGLEFPGRVEVHPLIHQPFDYGGAWRTWRSKVKVEAPYTEVGHWCNEMHDSGIPCAWEMF